MTLWLRCVFILHVYGLINSAIQPRFALMSIQSALRHPMIPSCFAPNFWLAAVPSARGRASGGVDSETAIFRGLSINNTLWLFNQRVRPPKGAYRLFTMSSKL